MSGLPDMHTQRPKAAGPRAEGVHIRQTMSDMVKLLCVIATPSGKQKAAVFALQAHNLIPQSNFTTLPIY